MDEGLPDGRSPVVAHGDPKNCLRGDVHSVSMWAPTKTPRTTTRPGWRSPVSRLPSSPVSRLPSTPSQRSRRLSPTRVELCEPVWKADGATSPVSESRPVFTGTTPLGGSLRVAPAASNDRRMPPANFATKAVNVPTKPSFEGPALNEKRLDEMELDSQIESMLASARKDLLSAEVGNGSDLAPKQQKPLNVDEAIRATLEVVEQERLARAGEIRDFQTKITSQQEWFAKELSRQAIQSDEAIASSENPRLSRLEQEVEIMRNQMFQPGEVTSRDRARGEAQEISQSTLASLQKAILSGPELFQYVQTLVDDRVQQAHIQSPSIISSPLQETILSSPESAQYVQKLVDDRVQHAVDAQLQERFNAPFTLAFVEKAIFSSPCLAQHVKTLADVQVQQVVDAAHVLKQELLAFEVHLQEEREMRAKSIHALHSRLASEIARISAASAKDRLSQTEELAEVRAIIDAVWARASRAKDSNSKHDFFKYVDSNAENSCRYKECVGDAEDIHTLYDMVREAVGNNESMKQDIKQLSKQLGLLAAGSPNVRHVH